MTGLAALAGGVAGFGAFTALGAGLLPATAACALSACLGAGLRQLQDSRLEREALRKAMDELQSQFVYLHQRQGQSEARAMEAAGPGTSVSAMQVATDIETLGTLISDLAKTVAEHDRKLGEQPGHALPAHDTSSRPASDEADMGLWSASAPFASRPPMFQSPAPQASSPRPEQFEEEAELGFTADPPASFATPAETPVLRAEPPSPEVIKELTATLSSALGGNRLELCLQPIVTLPQRRASGYEASLRLKGDSTDVQHDASLRRIAAATGLEADLDKALLSRAVQVLRILRARNRDAGLSCAVSMASILDRSFRTMLEDLARNDDKLAGAVTLELDYADLLLKGTGSREAIAALNRIGIGLGTVVSGHLRFDVSELVGLGIRQLRVPAALMQEASQAGGRVTDIHPADVAELLQRNNIALLVDGVATEETVREMLDYAAPLAQGDLFGASRAVRPEVLEPKAVGEALQKDAARGAPEKTAAPARAQRHSFRSLLRRA
jgi:EAL domain-containing protein (putative c-di-GMP-specific phosphodiesterase class I)